MNSFIVELPQSVKTFFDEEVASGRSQDHAELIEQLVRAEQKRRAHEEIRSLAQEALATPVAPWTKESMNHLRDEIQRRGKQCHRQ